MSSVSSFSTDVKPVPKRDQSKRRAGYQPKFTANGRPGKRTPQLEKALLAAIETGAPYRIACLACGISDDAFNEWRRKDPVFAKQVEEAAGKTALRLLKKIEANAEENFSAAAWILERRFPSDFSRPEIQFQINNHTLNQTVNNTLVVTAEVATVIQTRAERADANIEKLFRERNAAAQTSSLAGANGDGVREVETSLVLGVIVMPIGTPSAGWWSQFAQGDSSRAVAKDAAQWAVQTLAQETLGSRAGSVTFDSDVTVGAVLGALERVAGPAGWQRLLKKAERD